MMWLKSTGSTWTPKVCKATAFSAVLNGSGPTIHMFLGSSYSEFCYISELRFVLLELFEGSKVGYRCIADSHAFAPTYLFGGLQFVTTCNCMLLPSSVQSWPIVPCTYMSMHRYLNLFL